mmetsp:Transcript_22138/g.47066  ORF Transcript_22138/g.47066 Transcript_22138/m.47066 type:complete len:203 (+) Transcript_22138:970-1578(+)
MLSLRMRSFSVICIFTRARSSKRSNGLWTQSLHCKARPLTTALVEFFAETMIIGNSIAVYVFLSSPSTSKPLMPGIMRSRRMRSGIWAQVSKYFKQSVPFITTSTLYLHFRKQPFITSWLTSSSSTDKIRALRVLPWSMTLSTFSTAKFFSVLSSVAFGSACDSSPTWSRVSNVRWPNVPIEGAEVRCSPEWEEQPSSSPEV